MSCSLCIATKTLFLADHEYVKNISIQEQLVGKDIPYDITSSQMVCATYLSWVFSECQKGGSPLCWTYHGATFHFVPQFFLPVPLEDGWIILMWDMFARKLHVMDPRIRGDGPSEATKDKYEMIAWKLHHALFQCLNEYYGGWPTQGG